MSTHPDTITPCGAAREFVRATSFIVLALAGCAPPMYVPSPLWTPMHQRAGEVRVDGAFGTAGLGAVASVSPLPGTLLFAGLETEAAAGDTSYGRSRRIRGAGVGAFRTLGRGRTLEGLVGYDAGRVTTFDEGFAITFGNPFTVRSGWMRRGYAQVDIGTRKRSWLFEDVIGTGALSLRVSGVQFSDLTETVNGSRRDSIASAWLTVIEPGFSSGVLIGPVRLDTGIRLALPLGRTEEISVEGLRTDVRLSVAIDELLRGR